MHRFFAILISLPLYLLSLLPLRVHYLFADIIAFLLRDVLKYRRDVIMTNLEGAFAEMPERERRQIARRYYQYLADLICEMVWSMTRSGRHICRRGFYSIDAASERTMNEAYSSASSVVVLLSHTGNWELASDLPFYMRHCAFGCEDMTVAYQKLHDPLSEQLFLVLRRVRLHKDESLVPSHKILRFMLGHKNERRVYCFISDQYPYGGAEHTCKFLGLDTEWVGGAEAIARKLHLPVLYVYLDRPQRGKYVIKISQICSDASLPAKGVVTGTYASLLEQDIRNRKENWLWSHRRWKNLWSYNCERNAK